MCAIRYQLSSTVVPNGEIGEGKYTHGKISVLNQTSDSERLQFPQVSCNLLHDSETHAPLLESHLETKELGAGGRTVLTQFLEESPLNGARDVSVCCDNRLERGGGR